MTKRNFIAVRVSRVLLALLTLAVTLLMAGCSSPEPTATPQPTPTPTPQPIELVVLHTNDTLGYTEPCG